MDAQKSAAEQNHQKESGTKETSQTRTKEIPKEVILINMFNLCLNKLLYQLTM